MIIRMLLALFFFSVIGCSFGNGARDVDLVVETSNGRIRGQQIVSNETKKSFYAFQGIPFAKPPVGKLRFKAPEPPNNWSDILETTKDGDYCTQVAEWVCGTNYKPNVSENCLYLNVYSPNLKPDTPYPVFAFIHGGYFMVDDAGVYQYGPDFFVGQDVIVVSINYRLGIFGFLSTADEVIPGNFGHKDQLLALKWVQENIAKFGGDPTRVTLGGQSAGAASVAFLLQTPASQGLYHSAILESGSSLNIWSRVTNPRNAAFDFGNSLIGHSNTSDELLSQLQNVDANTLNSESITFFSMEELLFGNVLDGLPFGPTLEPEGNEAILTKKSHEELTKGNFQRVPILAGFNSNEGGAFSSLTQLGELFFFKYDMDPENLTPTDLNVKTALLNGIAGEKVKEFYFPNESVIHSALDFTKFITDHQFLRSINEFVKLTSKYVPTYFYRFSHEGEISPAAREVPGVQHSEELYYLWNFKITGPPSAEDRIVRDKMVKMWTNFIKYQNPTPASDPLLDNITWEPTSPQNLTFIDIDVDLSLKSNPELEAMTFWENIYNTYGSPPFDTY